MMGIGSNVKVNRRPEDGNSWGVIHRGVVVGMTSSHVQVFNAKEDSGDTVPEYAEWFPVNSAYCTTEEVSGG